MHHLHFIWICHFLGFVHVSFSKVTLFSLPEVFYRPQICQKCVGVPAPLGAFGASILAHSALDTRASGARNSAPRFVAPMSNPGYAPECTAQYTRCVKTTETRKCLAVDVFCRNQLIHDGEHLLMYQPQWRRQYGLRQRILITGIIQTRCFLS